MATAHFDQEEVVREIPKAQTKKIWKTFWILAGITALEFLVAGIKHPLHLPQGFVIFTFLIMTLAKAALIVAEFMHLAHEAKVLIWTIVLPFTFIIWLVVALLVEGSSILSAHF